MKSSRFYFVLIAVAVMLCPLNSWGADPEGMMFDQIKIRHLSAGKKVIPAECKLDSWNITDIKLPDIVVENRGKEPITIESIEAVGKDSGQTLASVWLLSKDITAMTGKSAAMIAKNTIPAIIQIGFGNVVLPKGKLAGSNRIGPGESALLLLSTGAYLHYVGHARIGSMNLALHIKTGEKKSRILQYSIMLTHYKQQGRYIFPLKGDLHMAFLPLSYVHHRASHSQEFAFDVVGAAQKGADFTEISTPQPKTNSDFSIWGRDVLAVGDGTVADIGDKFPDAPMSDPAIYGQPGYLQNLLKGMMGKIDFTNALAGNYIVIDHQNGEFSTYCHLKEGSLRVKKGDRVKQGAVIAQVGNTGNSDAPHLHFQVMDSADFKTANSLPVIFENMPSDVIIEGHTAKANTVGFSDNAFITIK